jgi:hypothetical protein
MVHYSPSLLVSFQWMTMVGKHWVQASCMERGIDLSKTTWISSHQQIAVELATLKLCCFKTLTSNWQISYKYLLAWLFLRLILIAMYHYKSVRIGINIHTCIKDYRFRSTVDWPTGQVIQSYSNLVVRIIWPIHCSTVTCVPRIDMPFWASLSDL